MSKKQIQLRPEASRYFWNYIIAILLIPIFGIGLYLLYRIRKNRKETTYIVTDDAITAISGGLNERVDLVNIIEIKINQDYTDKKFHIGNLHILTGSRRITLNGIKNPHEMANLILKAAEAERARVAKARKVNRREPETIPGTTDKLDYLTGLWQQGLLSEEDFLKEKKHFEP